MNVEKKITVLEGNTLVIRTVKTKRKLQRIAKGVSKIREIIKHSLFMMDQKKLERQYGLGPGESLGI